MPRPTATRGHLDPEGNSMTSDPFQDMIAGVTGYWLSRCIHVTAELGVADALGSDPQTAAGLAEEVGADPEALGRVMRLLAAHAIFERRADGQFEHNAASELLRSDHPQSLRAYARFLGSDVVWRCWGELETAVRSGQSAADSVTPGGLFAWLTDHADAAKVFDEAMAGKAHGQVAAIVATYDFSAFGSIADVGGGRGHLVTAILAAAPTARGVLFDLPHVIDEASRLASERLELQAGDFFTDSLPSCDAYVLLEVIHDWDDSHAARLLAAVRAAA